MMDFTNRPMFRRQGAAVPQAPSPDQVAQAQVQTERGINDVMQNLNADIDGAQNYEQVMNAIRGDEATVPERRAELAGIVGREDAIRTPESVLTLVQPVVEMSSIDQGIGELAQDQMQDQVSGAMAQGIMDMPVQKFQDAGEVKKADPFQLPEVKTLREYYQEALPTLKEIYGESDARDLAKGAALFNIADRGLRLASGQTPAEAFAGIGSDFAQQAAGISKADQALKASALQMAGTERAADRKTRSELLAKQLDRQAKIAEQLPTAFVVTRDTTIEVPMEDGTKQNVTIPKGTMRQFTPFDFNTFKKQYPILAQNMVAATDKQKEALLGKRTVLFPKVITFEGLEYQPGRPYQVDISDIPAIEQAMGTALIDGSNALNTILGGKPAPTNYVALEDILVNGQLIKKGKPVALTPAQARSPELSGKVAAAGTVDTQKQDDGAPRFNFRVQTAFSLNGRDFEVGDEASLTRAEAKDAPIGALLEIEKGKTVAAYVPENNVVYDSTTGKPRIFDTRQQLTEAINSGEVTKIDGNKPFASPQFMYKWTGSYNEVRPAKNHAEIKAAVKDGFNLTEKYVPQNDVRFKANGDAIVFDTKKPGSLNEAITQGFTLTTAPTFTPKILYKSDTGTPDVAETAQEFVTMVRDQGFTDQAPPRVEGTNYNENNNPAHYNNEAQRQAAIDAGYIYSSADRPGAFTPEVRFNDSGQRSPTARSNDELAEIINQGFYLTKKPEPEDITPSKARRTLLTLQNKISNGTQSPTELAEFQMAIVTLTGTPRIVWDGKEYKAVQDVVPPSTIQAIRDAKALDPEFDDMGLLDVPEEPYDPEYEPLIQRGVDYAEAVGSSGRAKQIIGKTFAFIENLIPSDRVNLPAFLTQRDTRKAADDIMSLNTITITRSLGSIAGKENATLIARLEALQPDPYSALTDPDSAGSKIDNMITQIRAVIETSKAISTAPGIDEGRKNQALKDIEDLQFLESQYVRLAQSFRPQRGPVVDSLDSRYTIR